MKLLRIINKIPFGFFLVFFLSLVPLLDLLHSGLPITHDGMDHVARIANFYKGLTDGVIFPRWAENLNWGYGHPVLMFLYPLSSYIASFFHFLSFSYVDSLKIEFGLGFIASGLAMYIWAREQFNEYFGIAAALLYLYAPYRFIDLYVRGAIGEHMAFIFPPLVLYFIFKYFKETKIRRGYFYFSGIAVSLALLILSHNAISIMFIPLIGLYTLFVAFSEKKYNKLLYALIALSLGFLLSGFFLFPAYFEGKFTLRDIVTGNEYKDRFINVLGLLYGSWNYGGTGQFSIQLGIANILGLILFPFVVLNLSKKKIQKQLLYIIFCFFVFSIFIMLPQSNFLYNIFTILKKFQFPWRFLSLTVFTTAVITSAIFLVIKKDLHKKIVLFILIIILLSTTFTYWRAKGFTNRPEAFYSGIYAGTTDTGESAPIWSIRFMEHTPKAHIEVISGKAKIREIKRTSIEHVYQVVVFEDNTRFRENTLYFPSWTVYANSKELPIQFQDPTERGLITFYLNKGNYKVDIKFQDTKLRILSDYLSLITFFAIFIGGMFITFKYKDEK